MCRGRSGFSPAYEGPKLASTAFKLVSEKWKRGQGAPAQQAHHQMGYWQSFPVGGKEDASFRSSYAGRGRRKEPLKRPMRALPTNKPPAEQEGQPRECPVCLEEVGASLLRASTMQRWIPFSLRRPPTDSNCLSTSCLERVVHRVLKVRGSPVSIKASHWLSRVHCLQNTANDDWTVFTCKHATCIGCYNTLCKGDPDLAMCPMCRMPLMEPAPGMFSGPFLCNLNHNL